MSKVMACMFLAAAAAGSAHADLMILSPARDTTLYEDALGGLANGAGSSMFVGRNSANQSRRALVSFDVAGAIPAGSTITGVILTLHMSQGNLPATSVAMHRATALWGEGASAAGGAGGGGAPAQPGDATWLHTFYPGQFWAAAGGDFSPAPSAAATVAGNAFYAWSSPSLIADVQAMLDAPAANFGWILIGDESAASTAKRFDTREHADPLLRPRLEVQYTPVPAPGAALLLAAAAVLSVRRRRTAVSPPSHHASGIKP
jgi:hypothetical protein